MSDQNQEIVQVRMPFPAIFRFNGMYFQEQYNIDRNEHRWVEISEYQADRWLGGDLSGPPTPRLNGEVWAEHGHPGYPCDPPEAVRGVALCLIRYRLMREMGVDAQDRSV